ncbi:MAG: hypothetical protein WD425_11480 [Nitrospirales bacterium]
MLNFIPCQDKRESRKVYWDELLPAKGIPFAGKVGETNGGWDYFLAFLSARFSFIVFAGFFFVSFLAS